MSRKPLVDVKCLICGKEEMKPHYRAKTYKTCSVECKSILASKATSTKVKKNCAVCGCGFYVKLSHSSRRVTCSKKCDGIRKRKMYDGESNPNYGNKGRKNPLFKTGRRTTHYGYIIVYKPDHPNSREDGYIFEHRLVMSEHLNRPLKEWEIVHHKDEDKQNNKIENLEIMTLSQHQRHHSSLKILLRDEKGRITGYKYKEDAK